MPSNPLSSALRGWECAVWFLGSLPSMEPEVFVGNDGKPMTLDEATEFRDVMQQAGHRAVVRPSTLLPESVPHAE